MAMEKEIFSQFFFGEENEANRFNETTNSIDSIEFQTREKDFFDTTSERNYNKRKTRDGAEMREEEDDHGANGSKPRQHATSSRRSRTTEMHNLSERRRRDKINEKLKALQELLPHCTKTDKASMLDEAIEYLKSLQIQLQMMWMENGMTPMVFPDMQQYMSMMAMDHANLAKITKMPFMYNQAKLPGSNSNPIQPENIYLPQFAPQGINQDGYALRLVQHEPDFGHGLVMGKNCFL